MTIGVRPYARRPITAAPAAMQQQIDEELRKIHTVMDAILANPEVVLPETFPPSPHTHVVTDITDFPDTFPPESHTHPVGDITGLPTVPEDHNDLDSRDATACHPAAAIEYTGVTDDATSSDNVEGAINDIGQQVHDINNHLLIHQARFSPKDFRYPIDDASLTPAAYVSPAANYNNVLYTDLVFFDDDQDREAAVAIPCPSQWSGDDFTVRFQWSPPTTASNGQVVRLGVAAVCIAEGTFYSSVSFSSFVYLTDTCIGSGGERMHITAESSAINPNGAVGDGKFLVIKVRRTPGSGGDNMNGGFNMLGMEVLFPAT